MTLTAEALDSYASTYYLSEQVDDIWIEEAIERMAFARVAERLRGCDRVLEMGYGTGISARTFAELGIDIEVLEGSPMLVEEARRRHPGLVAHEGMFESFSPGPVFDAVMGLYVFEHVDDPRSLLRHVSTWLRPGGTLVVAVPNAESLHRRLGVAMGLHPELDTFSARDHMLGHQRVYSMSSLCADIESAGFEVSERLGWMVKPVSNAQMVDWPAEVIEGLFKISADLPAELMAAICVVARKPEA